MNLRPGVTLDNRYELIARLGRGGQGTVWKALDQRTQEPCAVKIIELPNRESIERAHREADLVAKEKHPALIPCRSLFRRPAEDVLVLVFDFVESITLRAALDDPRFGRAHRLAALRHIAGGLAYIHGRGIVHRDLKPDNVLVTPAFWEDPASPAGVKIIDFGIAAPRLGADGATLSGMFGTAPYMAPELLSHPDLDEQRSPSRDVFAFGVLGWEMLDEGHPTGLPPKAAQSAYRDSYKHFQHGREPWPPRELAGRWGSIVGACLLLDPALRPRDGRAILGMLDELSPTPPPADTDLQDDGGRSDERRARRVSASTAKHAAPEPSFDVEIEVPRKAVPPEQAREPTIASAPAVNAVVHTEIAPESSLPRPSALDRTTPMPPDAESLRRSAAAVKAHRASRPEGVAIPERRSGAGVETAPRASAAEEKTSPPASEDSPPSERSTRAWRIVLLVLVIAVLVVGTIAVPLLENSPKPPAKPQYLPAPGAPTSSVPLAPSASASGSTEQAASASLSASASGPPIPLEVCCPSGQSTCSSGRACKSQGCKVTDVPGDRELALRLFQVTESPTPYDPERDLAAPGADLKTKVCVSTGDDNEVCLSIREIAVKGGAKSKLRIHASDIVSKGLRLRIEKAGKPPSRTTVPPTSKLQTSALCSSLTLWDQEKTFKIVFYLDDPDAPSPTATP